MAEFVEAARFEVFHLWCEQMRPEAKHKLVVLVHVANQYVLSFVINSRLNEFVQSRAHLLPCHAPLLRSEHPELLDHDSFVDCQQPYTFPRSSLREDARRALLSQPAQAAVLEAVRLCTQLKPIHKKLIFGL